MSAHTIALTTSLRHVLSGGIDIAAQSAHAAFGRKDIMKLVAYLRVSTDRQAKEGLGLDVQDRAIRRWARDNDHRIAMTTRDEGVSGSNGVDVRLGLHDALTVVKDRAVGGLVVYRLDRLARKLTV